MAVGNSVYQYPESIGEDTPFLLFTPIKASYRTGAQIQGGTQTQVVTENVAGGQIEIEREVQYIQKDVDTSNPMIALHVPRGLTFADNMKYNNLESPLMITALQQLKEGGIDSFSSADLTSYLSRSSLGGEFFSNLRRQNLMTEQRIASPREFVLFDAPSPRTFQLQFKFIPESDSESVTVAQIIKTFRKAMYPEFANETTAIYRFPLAFMVEYHQITDKHMIKFPEVVLQSANVTYNANSMSYYRVDGMNSPVEIDLSLTFVELLPQTRRDIEEGY